VPPIGNQIDTSRETTTSHNFSKRIGRSEWTKSVPEQEFAIYAKALDAVRPLGLPYLLGGAFGLAAHTGRWRNTKDLDLFVMPAHHEQFVQSLTRAGFHDYYERLAYDRGWIYRAILDDVIVDIIWDTPNRRCHVDEAWIERAVHLDFRGESALAVPPEEMIFIKSFVMQKDRCDWTDLINILCFQSAHLDWKHLIHRFGPELPILRALLNIFSWICPLEAAQIPENIRTRLGVEIILPEDPAATTRVRKNLLDSRPWFAAFEPMDVPMKL
jgi:hypothetical protein